MKQDMNGVRSAQDLERKYDLKSIVGLKKAVQLQEEGINKTNTELENFVNSTTSTIGNLQEQIDGNITTYYYSGVPTLSNLPVSEWEESKYNVHLGDLYYDKDTGYAYRFYLDSETNTYGWVKITDSDVTEALALANAANDTADSKRRVFVDTPYTPYDNGDLWIKDMEIYICQITKSEEEIFNENDFIIATKYTDDTYANEIDGKVTILSGRVTTVEEGVDQISANLEEQRYFIDAQGNKILISEQINQLTATTNGLNQSIITAGGTNIFRNVGLWHKQNDEENPYEYWNGKAEQLTNSDSSNMKSILLKKGDFWQEQTVNNGDYTVSFKYKKLIELANVTVTINDFVYDLTELDWSDFFTGKTNDNGDYVVLPLKVNTNHINVKFTSDVDNSLELYELMVNKGSNKAVWSQNENETTTDTVNIGKGITITSSEVEVKFKANATGIKTTDLNDNTLTEFTDKGMTTNEATIKNEANIVGILRQRVEDQIWDSFIG